MSDGKAGMEGQCLGLAEALGLSAVVKRIQVTRPWRWLPPQLIPDPLGVLGPKGDRLEPPWPALVIASGRHTVAPSMALRRASQGLSFTVQVQNPAVDPGNFDLIIAPRHDRLDAPNVVATTGALNRITPARLAAAAARIGPRIAQLPRPLVAVLLGGNSKVHRLTRKIARRLGRQLAELSKRQGVGLLVTPSRRTGAKIMEILRQSLTGRPAHIWDGVGENPYLGYLASADAFVVTEDSINMVSEAATVGKPVYLVELAGGSAKFRRFHETLRRAGITRLFEGKLETWTYAPLRDTEVAAAEIRRRLNVRRRDRAMPSVN